jgi:DNA-binding SARP family transcriptional activator
VPQLDFRILGPLSVRRDGHALALGGRRQRTLLALLLIRADEVVSIDRLSHDLWGEEPVDRTSKRLQVAISRLRHTLGPDPVVVMEHGGYRLRAGSDTLDAAQLEHLVAVGGAALQAGRTEEAGAALREALALWRGPPLADLAFEPALQLEIARLEERRLTALEERIDLDLALGRHAEVVAELEALVAEHPLRERLRAQLMLSLYRGGRQARALEVYRQGRHVLSEELGLDPGPALTRLEAAILAQDPSLDGATPRVARPRARRPRLTRPATPLIGRDGELAELGACSIARRCGCSR